MSNIRDLAGLLLVPAGLAILKAAVDNIPEDTTPVAPLIPELPKDTPFYPDLIIREKDKQTVTPVITPLVPVKQPGADFEPLFPETAVTAGQEFAAKDPFAGLAGLKELTFLKDLPTTPPTFNFDPFGFGKQ